jgi:hypothetical protein
MIAMMVFWDSFDRLMLLTTTCVKKLSNKNNHIPALFLNPLASVETSPEL